MVFNSIFASNAILSCFFLSLLIFDLYFLILAVIIQIFNSTTELAKPTEIPTKEAKAEMETYPVTAEDKISKCSIHLKSNKPFLFLPLTHFSLFIQ